MCKKTFLTICFIFIQFIQYIQPNHNILQNEHGTQFLNNEDEKEERNNANIFQKIKTRIPPNGEDPQHRQVINWKKTWPNGMIFFDISPEFNASSRQLIYEAMAEISEKTCIQFQKRMFEPDYIYFQMHLGDGCHTYAGMKGGKQILNLDPRKCIHHGKTAHELLHVIGFHHEHQRPDRDTYIDIKWNNIKDDDIGQFTKLSAPKEYLQYFPYDYGSLLHYGNISFFLAIDQNKPIIEAKQFAPNMGQRIGLSNLDVIKVNILYKCNNKLYK